MEGLRSIPRGYLIPISFASDMYIWTAERKRKDPFLVHRKKVKPSRARIVLDVASKSILGIGAPR
jgi:phytoene synthase